MICPSCGTHIPDDCVVCPACHAPIHTDSTTLNTHGAYDNLPAYCPWCGALVSKDEPWCPACGMRVRDIPDKQPERADEIDERLADPSVTASSCALSPTASEELGATHVMPRINSAVPPEPSAEEDGEVSEPHHTHSVVLAASLALLVVGGFMLLITHPWDPNWLSTRATEPADVSQAGFPGVLDTLSGQDKGTEPATTLTVDEATYATLHDAWVRLAQIRDELDDNEALLRELIVSGSNDERASGAAAANVLAVELSNLINDIGAVDIASGTYETDVEQLTTLANWLRNRSDNLCDAWDVACSYEHIEDHQAEVEGVLASQFNIDGVNAYEMLFNENYELYEPQSP